MQSHQFIVSLLVMPEADKQIHLSRTKIVTNISQRIEIPFFKNVSSYNSDLRIM